VRSAADAVRSIEPVEARRAGERARSQAERLPGADRSLGVAVLAAGVSAVAEHALRAADAREEDRRIAAELAARRLRARLRTRG
jgi:hypothetical protein